MGTYARRSTPEVMAGELYHGVPIQLYKSATYFRNIKPAAARFWFFSSIPERAWVLAWECKGARPEVYNVCIAHVAISHSPVDPPPMPEWASS